MQRAHGNTLAWLEARALLHHARTPYQGQARANPYGRIPGEAATALLLGPVSPPARCPAWCHVSALATADEPLTFDTEGPCVGAGLSAAAFAALDAAGHAATAIGQLIHDANGEPYRADEFGFTALRLADRLADGWRRISPALATGCIDPVKSCSGVNLERSDTWVQQWKTRSSAGRPSARVRW